MKKERNKKPILNNIKHNTQNPEIAGGDSQQYYVIVTKKMHLHVFHKVLDIVIGLTLKKTKIN